MIPEITIQLMHDIGLDVDSNNNVVDQDLMQLLTIGPKYLKCSFGPTEPFIGRDEMLFDPMSNNKLAISLLTYQLKKMNLIEERYFGTFVEVRVPNHQKTVLELKEDNGRVYRSKLYNNDALKYLDIIFQLNETNIDLSLYDYR